MSSQLHHLFAVLLVYGDPASPDELWVAYLPALCENFLRDEIDAHNDRAYAENRESDVIVDSASVDRNSPVYRRAIYLTLHDVNSQLISNRQSLLTYFESMPQFSDYTDVETEGDADDRNRNRMIENETSYESTALVHQAEAVDSLNMDKTKRVRQGRIALAVAGSGIAAQLLTGDRTAHSTYRLSLDPHETSTCNFGVRSSEAALLKRTSLIVWDEAPMTHRYQCEAVNRTLHDLLKNDMPFGGITVLMSGDFRQTLPVIPRAGPTEVISASLKRGATSSSCVFPLTCGFGLPETKTPPKTYSGLLITSFA
ncbi:hypothetical protein JG687_00003424 [Phytophthora cactorum]|uniref:ATP-dependent DNA helicase n=1 Tax=Phytophthora cactorum TaxID=29920 RepID=A0A8T1UU38_9STRA|nr:hypothetical protein JG687_00003424 [Phytophthora cactorum]